MSEAVVEYLRVSSQGQIEGDGFERQSSVIRGFERQYDLYHIATFREEGVSGAVDGMDRPAFARMMLLLEEQIAKGMKVSILIERMDRLARDLMVQEFILSECRLRGIKVYSADRGALIDVATDAGDPTQKLIRQIMGALAEWEKSMLVQKLRAARNRKKQTTGRCEGQKPYGARPGEYAIVDFISSLRNQGVSWPQIALQLNLGGTVTRKGTPWQAGTAHSVYDTAKKKGGSMK